MPDLTNSFSWGTHPYPAVGTVSRQILGTNPYRRHLLLINPGATDIWIALGVDAIVGRGIPLRANWGSYEMDGENLFRGAIHAISSAAGYLLATESQ